MLLWKLPSQKPIDGLLIIISQKKYNKKKTLSLEGEEKASGGACITEAIAQPLSCRLFLPKLLEKGEKERKRVEKLRKSPFLGVLF